MEKIIRIKSDKKERLDKFLTNHTKNKTRNQIQTEIKNGLVSVNDKIKNSSFVLSIGDEIKIRQKKEEIDFSLLSKVKILEENEDFLIINKPAGLLTHNVKNKKEASLVDFLLEKYPKIKNIGEDKNRPGIVHRLDKKTSGLLVVALNNSFYKHIKNEFKKRRIKKKYIALVFGQILKPTGEINFFLKRKKDGKIASMPLGQEEGREAFSEFRVLKNFKNYTLVEVKIKTGRTHQIRSHMAAIGHPIVRDDVYGTKKTKEKNKKLGTDRFFLFCKYLGFFNTNKEWREFEIDFPEKLKNFLKNKIK